jgi:hypothetical protein
MDAISVNTLDRLLAFFNSVSNPPWIGETFYQGENMPHVYFVSSVDGSNSNDGSSPRNPVAAVEEALDRVSANRGDVIFVMPGHTQTYTDDVVWDVAGVTIMGLGKGTSRPTFIIGDAAGESLDITGANIHVENCIFRSGIDAQTWMVGIRAVDVTIKSCDFREFTAIQPLILLDIGAGAAANAADRAHILGCYFHSPTAGDGDAAIQLSEINDRVVIEDCVIWGDYDDACIHNPAGKVLTNVLIKDCMLTNVLTGQHCIELLSACTGNIVRNMLHSDITQATAIDPGSAFQYLNYHDDVIDTTAILNGTPT